MIMTNRRSVALLMLLLLACFATRAGSAETSTVCDSSALPAPAQHLLTLKFSQWRSKVVSDMDTDDQKLWLAAWQGNACPGMVAGNFETAEKISCALLLVPKSNTRVGYKIIVLGKDASDDSYTWKLVDHAEAPADLGLVISKVPPGNYSDWQRNKSIQLKLDGLQVEWMEKGALVYYWSTGQYRRIRVSD
jgi:hypothetical protein